MYEVRLKFPHVPIDKHYKEVKFYSLQALDDFINSLPYGQYENYEIREVNILQRVCISKDYCESRSKCQKCKFKRGLDLNDIPGIFDP